MRLGYKRQADRVSVAIHCGTVELGLLYIVGGLSCRLSVVSLAGRRNDGLGEVEKKTRQPELDELKSRAKKSQKKPSRATDCWTILSVPS